MQTTKNLLISDRPVDTLENASAVISYLRNVSISNEAEFSSEDDLGLDLILGTVQQAIRSAATELNENKPKHRAEVA